MQSFKYFISHLFRILIFSLPLAIVIRPDPEYRLMKPATVLAIQRYYDRKFGHPPGEEWKVYGVYSGIKNRIALNLDHLEEEESFTVVYCITHEFLHYWIQREVGTRASLALDIFGNREHFPIREDEPIVKPVRWGGMHKRSLFHLMWVDIVLSSWELKKERMLCR